MSEEYEADNLPGREGKTFPHEIIDGCEAITNSEISRQIIIEVVDNGGRENLESVKEKVAPHMDDDEFYFEHLNPTHSITVNVSNGAIGIRDEVDIKMTEWGYRFLDHLFASLGYVQQEKVEHFVALDHDNGVYYPNTEVDKDFERVPIERAIELEYEPSPEYYTEKGVDIDIDEERTVNDYVDLGEL